MISHSIRRRLTSLLADGRRFCRDCSGGSIVELAFLLAFLGVPLLFGTADIGFLVYDSIEVSNAAHAGTAYGMQSSGDASDTADIKTAAQNDAPDIPSANLTVTPTVFFVCSSAEGGTQYSTQALATAVCPGPSTAANHVLEFVQVTASASVPLPFTCPGLPASYTLNSQSVMEVEE